MLLLTMALALQVPPDAVSVSTVTGGMLANLCKSGVDLKFDPCVAFILGAADALQIDRETCRPQSDASTLQTVEIVRRYIREHPENWGWSGIALVQTPLMKAFPCRRR